MTITPLLHRRARTRASALVAATAALAVVAGLVSAPAEAAAPAKATRADAGLFGSADPSFDGVYRQSMAILGLANAMAPVPASAVRWLVGQQCADGTFQAYRASTSTPCAASDPATFTGPDSNSTSLAAMALAMTGDAGASRRAINGLLAHQNTDGGWGYTFGAASDANSTGLALAALRGATTVAPARPASRKAVSFLRSVQVACSASTDTRFALMYQAGQTANASASVQGLIGLVGTLPTTLGTGAPARRATCTSPFAQQLASYVDQLVRTKDGVLPSPYDATKADWNTTALAVIALNSAGGAESAVRIAIDALGSNTAAYTGTGASASPAALGTLIQAAVTSRERPRRFGDSGANLVAELLATLRK